ncbi:MAG: hypothetical protein ACKOCD_00455 [Nitrospiraceae bacterium]
MIQPRGLPTVTLGSWLAVGCLGAPAWAETADPASVLSDSSSLVREQQDVESKLAETRARLQELQNRERDLNRPSRENERDRVTNSVSCSTPEYYYTHRTECTSGSDRFSSNSNDLSRQQGGLAEQLRSTNAEVERLTNRRKELMRQGESEEDKLKRLEFSGVTQECVKQQSGAGLQGAVSAYQRCWDGTSADQPRLAPETSNVPSLSPGPIEQMGIEDEKRRRRRAREAEGQ